MTEPEPLQQLDRTWVRFRAHKLSYFSGCDYFRLASHPKVLAAVTAGLKKYGLNVAASRLTTGNHVLYSQLERSAADFFAAEDALVVSSGYVTNLVAAQGLAGSVSHALLDARAHPSLADAAQFLNCPIVRFRSGATGDLAKAARRCGAKARLILLTEGMFSRDGSVAPLGSYQRALPKGAMMLVDDAHGAGVLGASGKGSMEHAGLGRRQIIQTVTFSKAFGAYGGAILGTSWLRRRILENSRLFVGSTPLPLPLASAALAGIELLRSKPELRNRLLGNVNYLREALENGGVSVQQTPGPIIALQVKNSQASAQVRRELLRARIYPPFIRYPGGAANGYLRFVICSEHTQAQLDSVARVLVRNANSLYAL
jgi:glycine C-acetyltransferase/8-amino-7-oxononanoate synthase